MTAGADILGQIIKYLILVNQSITIIIFIHPLLAKKSIIKLTKMSFYLWFRTGSGFKKLLYILYKALARW